MPNDNLRPERQPALTEAKAFVTAYLSPQLPAVPARNIMLAKAEEELRSSGGRVGIDVNGFTHEMRETARKPFTDLFAKWQVALANTSASVDQAIIELSEDIQEREPEGIHTIALKTSNETKKRTIVETFNARHDIQKLKDDQAGYKNELNRLVNISGSKPKSASMILYWTPLLGVGVGEWFINYSTFISRWNQVPAIAATIGIALIVAFASHYHGACLKQWSFIFGKQDPTNRYPGTKIFVSIITVLLFASFWLIGKLRLEDVLAQSGIDIASVGMFDLFSGPIGSLFSTKVAPTMILNAVVWCIGLALSFAVHEAVPGLREASHELDKVNKKLEKAEATIKPSLLTLDAELAKQLQMNELLRGQHNALRNDFSAVRASINALIEPFEQRISARANDAAQDYLGAIGEKLNQHGSDTAARVRFISASQGELDWTKYSSSPQAVSLSQRKSQSGLF